MIKSETNEKTWNAREFAVNSLFIIVLSLGLFSVFYFEDYARILLPDDYVERVLYTFAGIVICCCAYLIKRNIQLAWYYLKNSQP